MRLFITTFSLLIFFWNPINKSSKIIIVGDFQPIHTDLYTNQHVDFKGLWVNVDDQTNGITKCKISYKNNRYVVQMWGACHPKDCDWGENITKNVQNGTDNFQLLWDHEYAESLMTYEIIDGKLKVTNKRHYKDNSGRTDRTHVEYFQKE